MGEEPRRTEDDASGWLCNQPPITCSRRNVGIAARGGWRCGQDQLSRREPGGHTVQGGPGHPWLLMPYAVIASSGNVPGLPDATDPP
jgi:hypothetical protein